MTTMVSDSDSAFFKKGFITSLLVHLSILAMMFFKVVIFPSADLIYEDVVRVDLVALPDKLKPEEKQAMIEDKTPPPREPKVEPREQKKPPAVPDAINLNKVKSKQLAAIAKLKELQALEKLKQNIEHEARENRSKKIFKGNQISAGSELSGIAKLQHENYIANVKKHIYNNWALPEWLSEKNFRAQVLVRFDSSGKVITKRLVRSSGNASYDEVVLEAIDKSSPAPVPPENLAGVLANEGILVGFPD